MSENLSRGRIAQWQNKNFDLIINVVKFDSVICGKIAAAENARVV